VRPADAGMHTFRIEVGHAHGVKPGNIVGAIANEANIDSKNIGRIEIYDEYSVLDLPDNLPGELLDQLKMVWVAGQQLRISRDGAATPASSVTPDLVPAPARKTAAPRSEQVSTPAPASAAMTPAAPAKAPRAAKEGRGMSCYRIEVGSKHLVTPSNIVGAIANEANLEAKHIGRIDIFDDHSVLELPNGMPDDILAHLKTVWVAGQQLRIVPDAGGMSAPQQRGADKKPAFASKPKSSRPKF